MKYFVKGFGFDEGESILNYEAFIDTAKKVVVFRLIVKEKAD